MIATLAGALAGCTAGFLRHNFHPARIYMGDSGALFLGYLLAVIGVKLRFVDVPREVAFFVPILVLGVAVFDTTLVTIARLLHRVSPLTGGQDHTSHRLVAVGIPVRASVSLIYAAAIACGWLGVIMSRVDRPTGFVLMGFVLVSAAFAATLLAFVPVYPSSRHAPVEIRRLQRSKPSTTPQRDRRSEASA
jgi:UDP-GlcNAc:undecaprenyl-phosphate GlcNAc-1-phosphate transferase